MTNVASLKPHSVTFFANGMACVGDQYGNQMPSLQGRHSATVKLLAENGTPWDTLRDILGRPGADPELNFDHVPLPVTLEAALAENKALKNHMASLLLTIEAKDKRILELAELVDLKSRALDALYADAQNQIDGLARVGR